MGELLYYLIKLKNIKINKDVKSKIYEPFPKNKFFFGSPRHDVIIMFFMG